MKEENMKPYEVDASQLRGKALEVFHPKTIMEVKNIVSRATRVVPRGAGTGFAGGCIPQGGKDTVIDLSKLNAIGTLDKERRTIEVEAGVILEDLQEFLEPHRLEFPIDIPSKKIATIGGMIATNAFGSRTFRYKQTANWITWVEVVDDMGALHRKGATELTDYAGLEGITGVIVKACLKLTPLKARTASLIKLETIDGVIEATRRLRRNSAVSIVEFLDKRLSEIMGLPSNYHLIVEYESDSGILKGQEYEKQIEMIDKIYLSLFNKGYTRIEDPKILIDRFPQLVTWLEKREIPYFGHLAVGLIHPCFNQSQEKHIPEMIHLIKKLGGQISGKYGIGIRKKEFVDPIDQKIINNIKKRTDSSNKFNVGKII
ncbi:MAG: FAD-binding oxidoreductase [archaeon]|nr:FAD-binding oxidoreductase [archaeon]MCR4323626.1 FAD-binding oxidoreductase [Nanoarchaeota archaeon]